MSTTLTHQQEEHTLMGSTLAPPVTGPPSMTPLTERRQHLVALEKANHVRLARAALKRRVKEAPSPEQSRQLAAEILADPPDVLNSMAVLELIEACRRVGTLSACRLLGRLGISETLRIGGLSEQTRQQLIGALRVSR